KISEIFLEILKKSAEDKQISLIALGYKLFEQLSIEQIEGCIRSFLKELGSASSEKNEKIQNKIKRLVLQFTQERMKRISKPVPQELWTWLSIIETNASRHHNEYDEITKYLSENTDYRRSLQSVAIKSSKPDKLWLIFCLSHTWLWVIEEDIIFHLDNIMGLHTSDNELKWKELVRWIFAYQPFTGAALKHAQDQAILNINLKKHIHDIELQRANGKKEIEQYEKKQAAHRSRQKKKVIERHQQYHEIRDQLVSGKHINGLNQIAKAYLGWFSDIQGNEPKKRVVELLGIELLPLAINGICSAIEENNIPTVHEIIQLRINQNLISPFEAILLAYCDIILSRNEKLDEIPLNIAHSALAACHWGASFKSNDISSSVQKELEFILFKDSLSKENFIYETIEPYLYSEERYVPGLYRIQTDSLFQDIAGKVALKWLNNYQKLAYDSLKTVLTIAICYSPNDVIKLIREQISKQEFDKCPQRDIWISTCFLLDFESHFEILNQYTSEDKISIWVLSEFIFVDKKISTYWPKMNAQQLYFFILKFGSIWPPVPYPTGSWEGNQHPWDASRLIKGCITELSLITTQEAQDLISDLINKNDLCQYCDELKHALTENKKHKSESYKKYFSLQDVQNILLSKEPTGHKDLQALLIDQLEILQLRLKGSETSDFKFYWDNENPHKENYCRDLIASALTPHLEKYNARAHVEGARSDDKRCDLLSTYNLLDVPIEIKGQWHTDLWSAAIDQLQNYSTDYHANGFGVYLVLWFGNKTTSKLPKAWKRKRPQSLQEMKNKLNECYKDISDKTKIFVLDLSK
ncbi:TPA: hypothetical protein ACF6G0_001110, partial [Legionella pneumophila]|nr:hypothetical protein [Legionella pneumophila]HBD9418394.1 hypothetical protein [Legionella pneumophila]